MVLRKKRVDRQVNYLLVSIPDAIDSGRNAVSNGAMDLLYLKRLVLMVLCLERCYFITSTVRRLKS
jgi:hypothetical protein